MKLLQTLTSLLLATVTGAIASPVAAPEEVGQQLQKRVQTVQYDACPYPKWNITVINFEYTEGQKLADHRGLDWYGWSGFKRYYGYGIDGWSPNPSNYTTAHLTYDGAKTGAKFGFRSGSRAELQAVHSFWFNLEFVGGVPGTSVPIEIWGYTPWGAVEHHVLHTDPYADKIWEHVCLGWEVYDVTIVVPDCNSYSKGCKYAVFEVDDIWVAGRAFRPPQVKEPVSEYDSGKPPF